MLWSLRIAETLKMGEVFTDSPPAVMKIKKALIVDDVFTDDPKMGDFQTSLQT